MDYEIEGMMEFLVKLSLEIYFPVFLELKYKYSNLHRSNIAEIN